MNNKITYLAEYKNKKKLDIILEEVWDEITESVLSGDTPELNYDEYHSIYDAIAAFSEELDYMKEFGQIFDYNVSIDSNKKVDVKIYPVKEAKRIFLNINIKDTFVEI